MRSEGRLKSSDEIDDNKNLKEIEELVSAEILLKNQKKCYSAWVNNCTWRSEKL